MARPSPPSHLELASTGTVRRSLTFGSVSAGRLTGGALLRQVALLALLIVTAGFWIYFSVAASGFTSDFNLFSLLRFAAIQITIGFAQMVALSIGDLNLAVGAIGGAAGMLAGWVMESLGLPPEVAIIVALAAGTLLGFGNVLLTPGLSGALPAPAGLMPFAADHTASPSLGSDWLLASFVAPAIGGTLLSGGLVSVPGTIVGGVLLATISNGLLLVGIDNFWITVFLGVVLLLAVVLDRVTRAAGGAAPGCGACVASSPARRGPCPSSTSPACPCCRSPRRPPT